MRFPAAGGCLQAPCGLLARGCVGSRPYLSCWTAAATRLLHCTRGQAEGTEAFEELSDWTAPGLLAAFSRLAASRRAYNLVVTNVPGPPFPVFMDGARLLQAYPLVPLFTHQALGIALLSYDGGLYWGFNSCWDAMPDLHEMVLAVEREFETLRKL